MSAPKSTPTQSDAAVAVARAKLSRLIAAAFSDVGVGHWHANGTISIQCEIRDAAGVLGIDLQLVDHAFAALGDGRDIEAESQDLLGHTVRSNCPPYELEYRATEVFQQSQTLADICGFYRAFGFDAAGPMTDRADHVAAEWEFLAILAIKEASATSEPQRDCCIDAQTSFLIEHVAAWMPAFFERIRRADPESFLARIATLAEEVLREWCIVRKVPIGSRWLELRPVSEEDGSITCGAPGAVELGPTLAAAMNAED